MNITAYGRVDPDPFAMPTLGVRGAGDRADRPGRDRAFDLPREAPTERRPEPTTTRESPAVPASEGPPTTDAAPPDPPVRATEPRTGDARAPVATADEGRATPTTDRATATAGARPQPVAGAAAGARNGSPGVTAVERAGPAVAGRSPTTGSTGAGQLATPLRAPSTTATSASPFTAGRTNTDLTLRPGVEASKVAPRALVTAPDPRRMALAEAARDSILRTVALETRADGGRIRMTLQPRELGRLDLDVVVDDGNRARVLVVADRPEVAAMLERSLGELARTLAAAGLVVDQATVRQRQPGEPRPDGSLPTTAGDAVDHGDSVESIEPTTPLDQRGDPGRLDLWM